MTLRQRRAALAILAGVIGFIGGLYLESKGVAENYTNFLLLISYWIAPWLAVVFVDYWLRRGDYGDESVFYDTKHMRWQGFVAMAVGLVVSVYFFANNAIYLGTVPKANAVYGDLTFVVGFVITAVLYFVFNLGMRRQSSGAKSASGSRAA
jgi:purine-cytosine permease-like protein